MLDGTGNTDGQVDAGGDPGTGGAYLAVARHEAVVDRDARGAFGGAEGNGGLVEQLPVLHAVAAGEDELGFGHGNLRRIHGHRAEILDTRQAVSDLLAQIQTARFMACVADRLGAFGRGQDQSWQGALDILLATAGTASSLFASDLPDACRRALTELGGQAAAQFATTGAAVGQQPMAGCQLALHGAQCEYASFRGVAVEGIADDTQQTVDAGRVESAFLVFTEDHGNYGTAIAGQLARQAEQILVMAGQTATDHVRYHADVERRLLDDVQRQLHLDTGAAAFAAGALLGAAAVDTLEPGRADETGGDGMRVLADDAVGPHPAGFGLLHRRMQRVQAVAGDPLGAWVAADDVAHCTASRVSVGRVQPAVQVLAGCTRPTSFAVCSRFITAPLPFRAWRRAAWPVLQWLRSARLQPARRCP